MKDQMDSATNSEQETNHPGFRALKDLPETRFGVVICGGGLAGLTLALQLRREQPEISGLVAERTTRPIPESAFKVGESSVEMGSQYLEGLGLRDYLVENHLFKFSLRFFESEVRTALGALIGASSLAWEKLAQAGAAS